jgi:CsoR family transcriptional regulator, copper-sensing transcriptional repressor
VQPDTQPPHGPHKHTKDVLARLARVEGHVRAIKGMVEQDRPCTDVLIQLAAVKAAVAQIAKVVLADHVESCVHSAVVSGDADDELASLKEALDRYVS